MNTEEKPQIIFDESSNLPFGTWLCPVCQQTVSWSQLKSHQAGCDAKFFSYVIGHRALSELREWAQKHGEEQPHFTMKVSLNDFRAQYPEMG